MKRIIVLKEHHDTVYLDASTPEQMDRACLSVLRARTETPEYQEWAAEIQEPNEPALSFEASQALPPGKVREVALAEWGEYHKKVECYQRLKRDVERTKKALDENNGKLAYKILYEHRHHEDEGFEIREVREEY
jgi:hypothetical protein